MIQETVSSLAQLVGGSIVGDGDVRITGVGDLRAAGPQHIGFVRDTKYRDAARTTKAGALITFERLDTNAAQIVVADVGVAFAKVALHFHPVPRARTHLVHPTAVVHPEAVLEAPVEIGPHAVVGRARVGAGSVLMAGAYVADGCRLGANCVLYPNVVLYHGVQCGDRVAIHSGSVIGSDGFGYAREQDKWLKVPQLGGVRIADDVEVGANCAIDRGAIGDTVIGARTKIDNLCHIAHNCVTGTDCAFAAAAFLAGTSILGNRVVLGGHVVVAGHLKVCDDVRVGGNSVVLRDVDKPGDYMGYPLQEKMRFGRQLSALRDLVEMRKDVDALKSRIEALEKPAEG
jgi:UDP-3-O-[3-hydroxymyristoyl] glucosamine N-acyltransferase